MDVNEATQRVVDMYAQFNMGLITVREFLERMHEVREAIVPLQVGELDPNTGLMYRG